MLKATNGIGTAVLFAIFAVLSVGSSISRDRDPALYVGVRHCRLCHSKDSTGDQYGKWLKGPHAKTVEILGSDEAKAVGKKVGVANPQSSPKCLKCHSTAYHWTEEVKTEKIEVKEGIVCESCHGPGKNYKSKKVMQNRELCIKGGMTYPAMKSCVLCHNDESPTWDPERYTTKDGKKVGFDPELAYEKIKHANPKSKK